MNITFAYDYMIEILTALKNGEGIQYLNENTNTWIDHDEYCLPNFDSYEYRIKSESDTKSYRIAIMSSHEDSTCRFPIIVFKEECGVEIQSDFYFVCWHTDWMDY
jgi:hypothetical protein